MDKNKIVKIAVTVAGIGLTIASGLLGNKQQKDTIKEEVAKALAEQVKES